VHDENIMQLELHPNRPFMYWHLIDMSHNGAFVVVLSVSIIKLLLAIE
jgi:hypothetical protein